MEGPHETMMVSNLAMTTAIRVISLPESPRRDSFHRPPSDLGLDWRFVDASTGLTSGLDVGSRLSFKHSGRALVAGEIACYCSHVRTWSELLESDRYAQMIVIEDDVFVDWNFLNQVAKVRWSDIGVDYLKLYVKYPAKFRVLKWSYPIRDRHLVQYTSLALGANAYLLTRRAAETFSSSFKTISRPIDTQMDRPWSTGVPVVGIVPVGVVEQAIPSTISGREGSHENPMSKLHYYGGRLVEHARARLYSVAGRSVKLPSS